jgi:hypothetical protein
LEEHRMNYMDHIVSACYCQGDLFENLAHLLLHESAKQYFFEFLHTNNEAEVVEVLERVRRSD